MDKIHRQHRQEHGYAVEYVQEGLVGNDISSVPLQVFGNSYNGSHKNEYADSVKTVHVLPPRDLVAPASRISLQAKVE